MLSDRSMARALILATAAHFDYPPAEITGESRERDLAKCRHVAMAAVRKGTDLSWPEVAVIFGRAEDSIRYGVRRVDGDDKLIAQRDAVIAKVHADA